MERRRVTSQFPTLADLGWSDFFEAQLSSEEIEPDIPGSIVPMRISEVHRIRVRALAEDGDYLLVPVRKQSVGDFAVGDWVLGDRINGQIVRLLERKSLLQRLVKGSDNRCQLVAANMDTLFIVSSCNADFRVEWLDRFLAMAHGAGVDPVIVLTKTDKVANPDDWIKQADNLLPSLPVVALDALDPAQLARLDKWCGPGQTVAMAGSSGVGKSTLLNGLGGFDQATAGIHEKSAHGRHTTTARSLHRVKAGGWLIDTPGIQSLRLPDPEKGIDGLFSDISGLPQYCEYINCTHEDEPGCAIQAAILDGTIDRGRFLRWYQLQEKNRVKQEKPAEPVARWRKPKKLKGK